MAISFLGPEDVPKATLENLQQIVAGKYFFLGALTVLLYDHLLSLPAEVDTVWKRKKTYILYLFLLVRYYALVAVSVVAVGYFSVALTREQCSRWMLFLPLGITVPLTLFPGILMVVRIYALYNRNLFILVGLVLVLAAQTIAGIWQYTAKGATPAPDPLDNYEFHFCIYLPPKSIGHRSTMYIFWELGFDTLVFLLTVARTTYMFCRHQGTGGGPNPGSSLVHNLIRDGAFYFAVIFSINLTWVLMIMYAPTGLRAIASVPSACITTTMICRITLNLRTTVYGPPQLDARTHNSIPLGALNPRRRARCPDVAPDLAPDPDAVAGHHLRIHVRTDWEVEVDGEEGEEGEEGCRRVREDAKELEGPGEETDEDEDDGAAELALAPFTPQPGRLRCPPFSNGNGYYAGGGEWAHESTVGCTSPASASSSSNGHGRGL